LGTLSAGSNYSLSFVPAALHIGKATLTITADAKTKVYGSNDPALTYSVVGLVNSDTSSVLSGSLVRAAGSNVGTYAISKGSVVAGANYDIAFEPQSLTITPAVVNVYADTLGKTYGAVDPELTYAINGLVAG